MSPPPAPTTASAPNEDADRTWRALRAAAASAERLETSGHAGTFGLGTLGELTALPSDHADAALVWRPGHGWAPAAPVSDPVRALLDLYLPVCSATPARPITVGHLGQSLDGFIATRTGDSQFVTGEENILHLHRMRALSDAVIVGAGTVVADDPQLNTRHVSGPSPLRVIVDPTRRLTRAHRVFQDGVAQTLYACARSRLGAHETHLGEAAIVGLGDGPSGVNLAELIAHLRGRGCTRIFVEGGGVTVSAFFEAKLLDRLQVAIAPFFIGDGRPAIRLPGPSALRDCERPRHRVFRMGTDVLFDCDFGHNPSDSPARQADAPVERII